MYEVRDTLLFLCEMHKRIKFKLVKYKTERSLANENYKILCDVDTQTDHIARLDVIMGEKEKQKKCKNYSASWSWPLQRTGW